MKFKIILVLTILFSIAIVAGSLYTKKLINYLLESPDGPLFVIMRSEPDWEKLLGIDFQREYKNRFILRKRDINERRPRAQSINPNAFTDDGYRRILNAINPELNK